jgi:hypothetical protein
MFAITVSLYGAIAVFLSLTKFRVRHVATRVPDGYLFTPVRSPLWLNLIVSSLWLPVLVFGYVAIVTGRRRGHKIYRGCEHDRYWY